MKSEEGATAIEYALLAGLIAIILAAGAGALGTNLNSFFQAIATWLTGKTATVSTMP